MDHFSNLWNVKLNDFGRGLIIAIIAMPLQIIYESVTATPMVLTFNWKAILGAAIGGGIAYLIKNFATGVNGKLMTNK